MPRREDTTAAGSSSVSRRHRRRRRGTIVKAESPSEVYYKIERILDCRERDGGFEFLIRWENWDGDDTWEPYDNLDESAWQMAEFHRLRYLERKARQHCVFCHQEFDSRIAFGCDHLPHQFVAEKVPSSITKTPNWFCRRCGVDWSDTVGTCQRSCHSSRIEDRLDENFEHDRINIDMLKEGTVTASRYFDGCQLCLEAATKVLGGYVSEKFGVQRASLRQQCE